MEMYWALDYINETDNEYELVLGNQLYTSEAAAAAAIEGDGENIEINWYTRKDLEEDVYGENITIDENLHVRWI